MTVTTAGELGLAAAVTAGLADGAASPNRSDESSPNNDAVTAAGLGAAGLGAAGLGALSPNISSSPPNRLLFVVSGRAGATVAATVAGLLLSGAAGLLGAAVNMGGVLPNSDSSAPSGLEIGFAAAAGTAAVGLVGAASPNRSLSSPNKDELVAGLEVAAGFGAAAGVGSGLAGAGFGAGTTDAAAPSGSSTGVGSAHPRPPNTST